MASNEIQLQDTALFKYFDEVTLLHKCHVYEQAYFPFRENSCNKLRHFWSFCFELWLSCFSRNFFYASSFAHLSYVGLFFYLFFVF